MFKPKIKESRFSIDKEEELLKVWEGEEVYKFNEKTDKPIFSIDTPPPYASGVWHVAAAAHYAQIDMIARYFRMKNYEVLFPFGVDRNGLPIEVQVEKEYGIKAHEVEREYFVKLCSDFLDRVEKDLLNIARRLGLSCDLQNYYRTDSPQFRSLTQATFISLWRQNLIYEDSRPTNWCPSCKTTISDAEIDYVEMETELNYIKFKIKEGEGYIVIATTRPELLCSCAAILFNPEDARYQHLAGLTAITPIFSKEVPIIPHSYAKPEFGTGLVMLCSYGDYSDIRLFRELGFKPVVAINEEGKMNQNAGPYAGLKVSEARERIIADLKRLGLIVKQEKIRHRTPVCWRSKDPIEFIVMPEYYLKQLDFVDDLKAIVEQITFYPRESKRLLLDWINALSMDWPISRRRYYGTEIPLWYCKRCGKAFLPEPGGYYQPWKEKAPVERCDNCGSAEFTGEARTFDTWMDSSVSSLYVLGYMRNEELFAKAFPCTLRPQGVDIVRSWLYYSVLRIYQLFKKPAFRCVRLSGMGLDERGEAMHKSKGNIVYPMPIIEKYGADAFRFWSASESKLGSNYRFSESRIKSAKLFITKLWNIGRFISSFPLVNDDYALNAIDKWILAELNGVVKKSLEGYDELDVYVPANSLRDFTWSVFADHYVEAVKPRAYNTDGFFNIRTQRGAWFTLHTCFSTILKLLAPICPFITDILWRGIYNKGTIHREELPKPTFEAFADFNRFTSLLLRFNNAVWRYKKSIGLALSQKLDAILYVPSELEAFADDLKAMHKIRELRFGIPPQGLKAEAISDDIYVVKD